MDRLPTTEKVWLTADEAAAYCNVNRVSLWRARRQGLLRAGGWGRAVRYERRELDRFMRGEAIDK